MFVLNDLPYAGHRSPEIRTMYGEDECNQVDRLTWVQAGCRNSHAMVSAGETQAFSFLQSFFLKNTIFTEYNQYSEQILGPIYTCFAFNTH